MIVRQGMQIQGVKYVCVWGGGGYLDPDKINYIVEYFYKYIMNSSWEIKEWNIFWLFKLQQHWYGVPITSTACVMSL